MSSNLKQIQQTNNEPPQTEENRRHAEKSTLEIMAENAGLFIDLISEKTMQLQLRQIRVDPSYKQQKSIAEINNRLDEQLDYAHWLMLRELLIEAYDLKNSIVSAHAAKEFSEELMSAFQQVIIDDTNKSKRQCISFVLSERQREGYRQRWRESAFSTEAITLVDVFHFYKQAEIVQATIRHLEKRHARLEAAIRLFNNERGETLDIQKHPYWSVDYSSTLPPYAGLIEKLFRNLEQADIASQHQLIKHLYPELHRQHFATLMCAFVGYELRPSESKELGLSPPDLKLSQEFVDGYFEKIGGRPPRQPSEYDYVDRIFEQSFKLPFCSYRFLRINKRALTEHSYFPVYEAKLELSRAEIQHRLLFDSVSPKSPAFQWSSNTLVEERSLANFYAEPEAVNLGFLADYLQGITGYEWLRSSEGPPISSNAQTLGGQEWSLEGLNPTQAQEELMRHLNVELPSEQEVGIRTGSKPQGELYFSLLRQRLIQIAPPLDESIYIEACDADVEYLYRWFKSKHPDGNEF